jgi:hypothetical protein
MKNAGAISAFYRIFGQSFEIETADFWENEKDFGKTTVDSWGHEPRRRGGKMRRINGKPTVDSWRHEPRRRIQDLNLNSCVWDLNSFSSFLQNDRHWFSRTMYSDAGDSLEPVPENRNIRHSP